MVVDSTIFTENHNPLKVKNGKKIDGLPFYSLIFWVLNKF
jgi:hypothetical protein